MGKKKKAKGAPGPLLDDGGDATPLTHTGKMLPAAVDTFSRDEEDAIIAGFLKVPPEGIFDVFADQDDGAQPATSSIPSTAVVFDIAASDVKKMQDDHDTQLPLAAPSWHDVPLEDHDFTGFHFTSGGSAVDVDELDGGGHAVHESQKQSGPPKPESELLPGGGSDELCALGNSDMLGYDYTLGPQSDIHAGLHSPQMPSDGFEATVDPGRGRREPVVAAAAAAAAAAESLKGEAAATAAANDPDLPGSPEFLLCAGMQGEFQTHARSILPDVFPVSDEEEAFEEPHDLDHVDTPTQCGPMPQEHMQQAPCVSTDHSGKPDSRAQCGPLPQEHMQQPPCALSDHSGMRPVAASYHAWSGYGMATTGTSRTQFGLAPLEHMQQAPCASDRSGMPTSRTQCGLDVESLNIFDTDLDADGSLEPSRTQCGLLPQQHMQQTPCSISDPSAEPSSRTQCGPLPQVHMQQAPCAQTDSGMPTSRTQCELWPRDFVQPLQETLAQLVATTLAPSPSLEERYARLEAFAAATSAALAQIQPDGFDGSTDTVRGNSTTSEQLTFGPSAAQLASQHPPRGKGKGKGKQGKGRHSKGSTGKRGSVTGALKASSATG